MRTGAGLRISEKWRKPQRYLKFFLEKMLVGKAQRFLKSKLADKVIFKNTYNLGKAVD